MLEYKKQQDFNEIIQALDAKRSGSGWIAHCPAHDDKNPSLSIGKRDDGKILLHCFAGCSQESVIEALRGRGLWPGDNGDRHPISPRPPGAPATWGREPARKHYVAHWTYYDSKGQLLGFVVRYEDDHGNKDVVPFFRRRNNKWKPGAAPEPRPLYCLHKLAEKPHAPVVVTEGEKAADAAARLLPDYVTVTSPGGSNAADKSDWRPLEGRTVLIWPDHDEPGRKYASAVYRLLKEVGARSVQVIDVKALGMTPGQDAADWPHEKSLPEPLPILNSVEMLSESKADESERLFPRIPFPLEIFPSQIADSLRELAAALAAPVAPLPGAVFAVLGAALGRSVAVSPKPGWLEPPIIWHGHIADSGESKTPGLEALATPLREVQAKECRAAERRLREWKNLSPKVRKEVEQPAPARTLYASDLTLEGLRAALAAGGHGGLLVAQDELSSAISSQNQYKRGRGSDRETWLSLWSGIQAHTVRVGGNVWIDRSCVCLVGGIQPRVFTAAFDPLRQYDGSLFRFLFVYEPPTHRELGVETWGEERRKGWRDLIFRALGWADEQEDSHVILFDKKAQGAFFDWRNNLDSKKLDLPPIVRGFLPKAYSYSVRLTGLLACLRAFVVKREPPRIVGRGDFERARLVVEFYLGQALDALTLLVGDEPSPPAEVSERTLHLAHVLHEIKPLLDSGRLAVGYVLEQFNKTAQDHLTIKTARAMGTMIRSAGLTVSNGVHDANGRKRVKCLIWDKKTESFLKTHLESLESLKSKQPCGIAERDIENATSRMSRNVSSGGGESETCETLKKQSLAPENSMVKPKRDNRDMRDNFSNIQNNTENDFDPDEVII